AARAGQALSTVLDLERKAGQPFDDCAVERGFVLLGRVVVERLRVRVADVGEDLRARFKEVDVVAVTLFGFVSVGLVVRSLGCDAVVDQAAVFAGEQVELASDNVAEAAAEDHPRPSVASSRYSSRCARAAAPQVSSARARRAPARASSRAAGSFSSSRIASASDSTSPAGTTRPAPKRRTGSAIPPTSYATPGTPAPSACSSAPPSS